jgi:CRP/FNR family transcriptional regulator, cyclic AMP receptor protein
MGPSIYQSVDIHPLLNSLSGVRKTVLFRKRQTIFAVGDRSDSIFFIERGTAKLTVTSLEGREAVVTVLDAGHFFGEGALNADRLPRANNAIALTDLRVWRIERDTMLRLLRNDRDICLAFTSYLIQLVEQLRGGLSDSLLYASEQRLALALLAAAPLGNNDDWQWVPNLSQQDLANMIGTTRQRVNALMRGFWKLGFIDYSRGLRVHSSIRSVTDRQKTNAR